MEAFRTTDVISLSFIAYVLISLVLVLAAAYAVLLLASKKLKLATAMKADVKNITVIETKYAHKIGHISLISVADNQYLVVNSANGIAISPVVAVANQQPASGQTTVVN